LGKHALLPITVQMARLSLLKRLHKKRQKQPRVQKQEKQSLSPQMRDLMVTFEAQYGTPSRTSAADPPQRSD